MKIATIQHYWDTPSVAGVPAPTTVVVAARCGARKVSIPAWMVREWADRKIEPVPERACPHCVAGVPWWTRLDRQSV
jgi:hypothetical protein